MSDRLYPSVLSEIEHTVNSSTHRNTSGVVVSGSECTECLALDIFNDSGFRIVFLFRLTEEPVHSVLHARSDVDVFECSEVRKSDLEIVSHSVLELIKKARLLEFRSLEIDPVLE